MTITKEQAVQLAREAGFGGMLTDVVGTTSELHRLVNTVYKLARNQALDDAILRALIHSQYPIATDYDRGYAKARKDCANTIESLKDNTPMNREQLIKALEGAKQNNLSIGECWNLMDASADMLEADGVPVAWIEWDLNLDEGDPDSITPGDKPAIACDGWEWRPLVMGAAPTAQRVPLTDEQIANAVLAAKVRCVHPDAETTRDIARAIEAAHGIKEGGEA